MIYFETFIKYRISSQQRKMNVVKYDLFVGYANCRVSIADRIELVGTSEKVTVILKQNVLRLFVQVENE